jgi:hypothetical protein
MEKKLTRAMHVAAKSSTRLVSGNNVNSCSKDARLESSQDHWIPCLRFCGFFSSLSMHMPL